MQMLCDIPKGSDFFFNGISIKLFWHKRLVPECIARVSTLRLWSQPSPTVRNRPQPLRFAWQAWHFVTSDMFCNVSKVVLCGRRNTFAMFSEDALQFSWQAQDFGRVHRHSSFCVAGAAL